MNRVAKFEKVSFEQFKKDYLDCLLDMEDGKYNITPTDNEIEAVYGSITLPKRSTSDSAGYDFISPMYINLKPSETIKIPTGIRCKINESWFLAIAPRSGLGFKYRTQLDNTLGIIDGDYYYANNEGHIMVKLTNDSKDCKELVLPPFSKVVQGIFIPYGITVDDDAVGVRTGGMGSTGI